MKSQSGSPVARLLGAIPHRLQLAGGWIDQPFVSRHNPKPPGSMVVAQIEPEFRPMDRAGIASGTRAIAMKIWKRPKAAQPSVRRIGARTLRVGKQGQGRAQRLAGHDRSGISRREPSGLRLQSSRRHFSRAHRVVQQCKSGALAQPGFARSPGRTAAGRLRSVGGIKNLDPKWVARLGQSGRDCYDAIVKMDAAALGASLNLTMKCWETLLPHVVRHPLLRLDLMPLLPPRISGNTSTRCIPAVARLSYCCLQRTGRRRI